MVLVDIQKKHQYFRIRSHLHHCSLAKVFKNVFHNSLPTKEGHDRFKLV